MTRWRLNWSKEKHRMIMMMKKIMYMLGSLNYLSIYFIEN